MSIQLLINLLNGLSAGLLLFLLSAGLTMIFSMLGVLNFAHASFYMLGAYLGYSFTGWVGFGPALVLAPLTVGLLGMAFERVVLRCVRPQGPVAELLVTFGLSYVVLELVQRIWGREPLSFIPPTILQGPAFTLVGQGGHVVGLFPGAGPDALCGVLAGGPTMCAQFPRTRVFIMAVALMLFALQWLLWRCTRLGWVVQAALSHPQMTQALGHNVPAVFTGVFGGGCALAAVAGVLGGSTFVTEPGMAATVGPLVFVVIVVGGLGSLGGALVASLLIGLLQTLPLARDQPIAEVLQAVGVTVANDPEGPWAPIWALTLAQLAPVLPYALMVGVLAWRPRGLWGRREE